MGPGKYFLQFKKKGEILKCVDYKQTNNILAKFRGELFFVSQYPICFGRIQNLRRFHSTFGFGRGSKKFCQPNRAIDKRKS